LDITDFLNKQRKNKIRKEKSKIKTLKKIEEKKKTLLLE